MLSLSDELTGLYNRRGLFALGRARDARRPASREGLGVISIDVDGLKTINDRYGHAQGDETLRAVADVIRASIRESDVVGRVGGDEFVILADDGPGITGDLVARLRRRVDAPTPRPGGRSASRSASEPSTGSTGDQVTLQELIERADQRMYDDKRARRQLTPAGPGLEGP